MGERLTCIDSNNANRFYTRKLPEWLPDYSNTYQEYNFFKEKFLANNNIKLLKEQEIIYIQVSEYEYNGIEFNMVLDLDYDLTDFLVRDETKVDVIRKLVEDTILKACKSKKWVEAAILLNTENVKVACPECEKEFLEVLDIDADGYSDLSERYIHCPLCKVHNILRRRRK
jgi:hypothetical protein